MKSHLGVLLGAAFLAALGHFSISTVIQSQRESESRLEAVVRRLDDPLRDRAVDRLRSEQSDLRSRLDLLAARQQDAASAVAVSDELGAAAAEIESLRLDLGDRDRQWADRLERLESRLDAIERAARRGEPSGHAALAEALLPCSVQVSARGGVGGGTIVYSGDAGDGSHETFVVSAWHVVSKSVARDRDGKETRHAVDVRLFDARGDPIETVPSDIVVRDERRDLVLLKLRSAKPWPAARLMPAERIGQIDVFTPIVAVGCPLGHDPMPSPGEISSRHKQVNGERFWMMNAPTIFGNSGGGVFRRDTMELMGISAMICTFDNPVTTPVPHLGILVPLDVVYEWLSAQHYEYLFDARFTRADSAAKRERALARVRPSW